MDIDLRAVAPQEYPAALELWDTCFRPLPEYFRRYFEVDPWYRPGDCLGAFSEGRLVSAVHLCRRPLRWNGETLWCGAIANVATLPDFRRRGLSREILARVIRRMEEERLHFSMLFTGQYGHYAAAGWEYVPRPRYTVRLDPATDGPGIPAGPLRVEEGHARLYADCPRPPLLLERPVGYFRGWSGWSWGQWKGAVLELPERGYAVLRLPDAPEKPVELAEIRARDEGSEAELLRAVAGWARGQGRTALELEGLPLLEGEAALRALGEVVTSEAPHMMLRKVGLEEERYREVVRLYRTGEAPWFPADGF